MKALTTMIMPAANDDTTYCTRRAETILTLNSCDPKFQNNDLGQFILYSRYIRVANVVTVHNDLLTQWRHI